MISDILRDAVGDIDSYLNDPAFSKIYSGELRESILKLRADMMRVQVILDTPLPTMVHPAPLGVPIPPADKSR